jgi:uncharacterized protein (DUF2164 family)
MLPSLPPDQKRLLLRHIQDFFYEEHGEKIGLIAAERFLNFVAFELGPAFYNLGVQDARKLIKDQMEHLETELAILERPLNPPKRK